jgi:ribonuclease BN (tRNA processing enzyme)
MSFEVVVLGASGTYPVPGRASSGYLLRSEGVDVWLDAGTGTFANLQQHVNFLEVHATVLSHMHSDHFLDLYPFYFGMRFHPTDPHGFAVYAPAGAEELMCRLFATGGDPQFEDFGGYLKFADISSGGELDIGPFHFRFVRSVHPIETLAMRIEAGGRVLGYTADTAPSDDVARLVEGADILIAEATLQAPDEKLALVHMTAEEAGQMAAEAGAGRCVLTHLWPTLDPKISVEQAGKHFDGEILLAADHFIFEV